MDFAKLLKKSGSTSNIDKFRDAIEKDQKKSFDKDAGEYWKATVDKAGNGYAVIRFLPTPPQDDDDGLPWSKFWHHSFQGPTGLWYIENSLTTLGRQDPVSDYNSKLWATGLEANQKIARDQKRKLTYVSNVYIVSDPKNPENEGKVFKFKYGKKIFEKLDEAMNPSKYDEFTKKKPINPFDLIDGANFELKIRKVDGYTNYDKSGFEEPLALLGGDEKKLEAVWKSEYALKPLVAEDQFKDYATLKQRLDKVLGIDTSNSNPTGVVTDDASAVQRNVVKSSTAENVEFTGEDDDPTMFANLAK